MQTHFDTVIIGGGLGGLIAALSLAKARPETSIALFEKKNYPFHRVCGEYISNEVKPFLVRNGWLPTDIELPTISRLQVSAPNGTSLFASLTCGGFGISRYHLDYFLYQKALAAGITVYQNCGIAQVVWQNNSFVLDTEKGETLVAKTVIGAFGKRSTLDKAMQRPFMSQRSPYIGVKRHISYPVAPDLIALHNFTDGYCGISAIENQIANLCYLTTRAQLQKHRSIEALEAAVLCENKHLKHIFEHAVPLRDKPEVINEISFARKNCVENHILMAGDSAGLITPLCGNGMAMAIHAGYLAAQATAHLLREPHKRNNIENAYQQQWERLFAKRLQAGRAIQTLFGNKYVTAAVVGLMRRLPHVTDKLISLTHGTTLPY